MKTPLWTLILLPGVGLACANANPDVSSDGAPDLAALDAVFADFGSPDGPGCAFAVSRDGQQVMARAYGMADLEWGIPNTPETVFEPGSVSKQFTRGHDSARAGRAHRPRRRHPRVLPRVARLRRAHHRPHAHPSHSGLRDWGAVASIEGWPRWSRVHSHKHALDIASRQRALNYEPGRYYSYTNRDTTSRRCSWSG